MSMVELQNKTQSPIIEELQKSSTLASMESLSMPEVHEVVFLADFRSSKCQERVAEVMSKMNGEQSVEAFCMVMRLNLDCNACCKKLKRHLLKVKEIETYLIEKEDNTVSVCGRGVPADVAIKIRRRMKRRVQILEIQDMGDMNEHHGEQMPPNHDQENPLMHHMHN